MDFLNRTLIWSQAHLSQILYRYEAHDNRHRHTLASTNTTRSHDVNKVLGTHMWLASGHHLRERR